MGLFEEIVVKYINNAICEGGPDGCGGEMTEEEIPKVFKLPASGRFPIIEKLLGRLLPSELSVTDVLVRLIQSYVNKLEVKNHQTNQTEFSSLILLPTQSLDPNNLTPTVEFIVSAPQAIYSGVLYLPPHKIAGIPLYANMQKTNSCPMTDEQRGKLTLQEMFKLDQPKNKTVSRITMSDFLTLESTLTDQGRQVLLSAFNLDQAPVIAPPPVTSQLPVPA